MFLCPSQDERTSLEGLWSWSQSLSERMFIMWSYLWRPSVRDQFMWYIFKYLRSLDWSWINCREDVSLNGPPCCFIWFSADCYLHWGCCLFLCVGLFVSGVTLKVRNRLQCACSESWILKKAGFPLKISSNYRLEAFLKKVVASHLERSCGLCTTWWENVIVK